ncbi:receptor-type guanylate cyclase gcy-4-like [Carassius auratus]|uniref:Receptor-type guanylate cyclase gcy-4-like n=1 Tax=Carassius auratus TaxID=7957 RepID=A0A6P6QXN4_CARAU|nr:receptor-type guanylate cyclase gcy-4-like [Carassius auratus]
MVVAGVVGHKMPRYGLHGDTVHTASAMESNGKEMHIQLSSATNEHLKGSHFIFERRGTITIKIETYWLKGKRDKDGNARAACPQLEAQTISKAAISAPEAPIDEDLQVFPSVAGEDEDDVKSIRSHRMKMETSGNSLEECRVEGASVSKSHYKDALQDSSLQDPHTELDSAEFDVGDSILESPAGSWDSHGSEKSTMCSVC